jgi:hypothetical protein
MSPVKDTGSILPIAITAYLYVLGTSYPSSSLCLFYDQHLPSFYLFFFVGAFHGLSFHSSLINFQREANNFRFVRFLFTFPRLFLIFWVNIRVYFYHIWNFVLSHFHSGRRQSWWPLFICFYGLLLSFHYALFVSFHKSDQLELVTPWIHPGQYRKLFPHDVTISTIDSQTRIINVPLFCTVWLKPFTLNFLSSTSERSAST